MLLFCRELVFLEMLRRDQIHFIKNSKRERNICPARVSYVAYGSGNMNPPPLTYHLSLGGERYALICDLANTVLIFL